jgi:hypothetical protein
MYDNEKEIRNKICCHENREHFSLLASHRVAGKVQNRSRFSKTSYRPITGFLVISTRSLMLRMRFILYI